MLKMMMLACRGQQMAVKMFMLCASDGIFASTQALCLPETTPGVWIERTYHLRIQSPRGHLGSLVWINILDHLTDVAALKAQLHLHQRKRIHRVPTAVTYFLSEGHSLQMQ